MAIRVCTLPGLRILAPSGEVTGLQGRGLPLGLLVYLAVERSASRDSLLPLFWPDRDDERARHSLSQTLYEIRRVLGPGWLAGSGDVLAVASDLEADVARFELAVESGRHAQALDLYGGGFLDGLHLVPTRDFEEWVDRRRGQVARLHRKARREVVSERLRVGDVAGALALASRWAELEPLDDEAQQRTIELLARTGRRAEALRQYESFRERLRREELEPMPELEQIAAAIRSGATGAQAPEPAQPDAGEGPLPGLASDLEVVRLLAEGRNARVYLAREPQLGRLVAIKVLSPESVRDAVLVRRFEREARAIARIRHPNVAPLYRIGALASGARYLVMPYIDGGTLEDRLAARGRLPLPDARRVLAQLASALAAAHHAGIVHRDLRPGNVLYDRESDRVLLVDFGTAGLLEAGDMDAARLTRPGEALGLPAYASPEQLRGDVASDRSDVYSLGVLAFEILTGRLPFPATTPLAMTAAHLEAEPPLASSIRPEVVPELDELIRRCLNKRPEQRPFAAEVAAALEA